MNSQENPLVKNLDFSEADNFFKTIGEVSAELGIPPHVLRFWESKFFRIKPHKRKGGHRYYSKVDVDAIHQIKKLLYDEGYTIKGAQKFLREKGYMQHNQVEQDQQSLFSEDTTSKVQATIISNNATQVAQANENIINISANNAGDVDPRVIKDLLRELEAIKKTLEEK
jgi:DNA-binding transcriptional MerR regulator